MYLIKSPNPAFSGVRLGVVFADGVGQCYDDKVLAEFKSKGYTIETPEPVAKKKKED
jgi:hypothetical protein